MNDEGGFTDDARMRDLADFAFSWFQVVTSITNQAFYALALRQVSRCPLKTKCQRYYVERI